MLAVRVIAWVCFGAAALSLWLAVAHELAAFVSTAFAAAVSGVLLLAVDLALVRLTEIRDALRPAPLRAESPTEPAVGAPAESAASLAELERKLAAKRG